MGKVVNRVRIRPEQIYVAARMGPAIVIGGDAYESIPWGRLAKCIVYTLSDLDLAALLRDAVDQDHMILDGSHTERKGLRGFSVGIGAWGSRGVVECRCIDTWCVEPEEGADPVEETGRLQKLMRALCNRLNVEETTFRGSGLKWLSGLAYRLSLEPYDAPDPLPAEIAMFCRRAHVGGPVVHCRTTLAPFVSIDRDRAYGHAMLDDLPCGPPADIALSGTGLNRWRPRDLQSMTGVAEATVTVKEGPFVPLLPLMSWHHQNQRVKTLYPTGRLRGVWCLQELQYLEQSGRGAVEALHRVITFEPRPVLAPVISYLRSIEKDLPIRVKRLEHMLYGSCGRNLQISRFATGYDGGQPLVGDVMDPGVVRRLGPDATMRAYPLRGTHGSAHRLYRVVGKIGGQATKGTVDRPDRSAWITSRNRIEMSKIIDQLDSVVAPARSGSYIGRIYVDGMDVEIPVASVPKIEGASIRMHGSKVQIFRAGSFVASCHDGVTRIETAGTNLPVDATEDDLKMVLSRSLDLQDAGPFAGGRSWPRVAGVEDPRMLSDQRSEPLHLDLEMARLLGFSEV